MFDLSGKKKKILTISAIVYAVLILFFIFIVNFEKFNSWGTWLSDKFSVLSPIFIGAVIAYLAMPLVHFFQDRVLKNVRNNRTRRGVAVLLTYIVLLLFIGSFVGLIIPQLLVSGKELIEKLSDGTYLNSAVASVNDFLNNLLSLRGEEALQFIDINKLITSLREVLEDTSQLFQKLSTLLVSVGTKFVTGIKNILIGFLISIYFIITRERLFALTQKLLNAIFSEKRKESVITWTKYADKTFGGFVVGKIIDATFMIVMCSIVFSISKIPYSLLISVVIGISNFIPFFGPFIGAIPSGFIVLVADPGRFILFVILLLVIQQFDANVLEPKIVGDKTGLSSLGVIVAVTVMGGYFGIIGLFFGVPIFAIICTVIDSAVNSKLNVKELPTDAADYYPEDSLIDPRETRESLSAKIFRVISSGLKNIQLKIVSCFQSFSERRKLKQNNKKGKKAKHKHNQ